MIVSKSTKLIHQRLEKHGTDIIDINVKLKGNMKDVDEKVTRCMKTLMTTN